MYFVISCAFQQVLMTFSHTSSVVACLGVVGHLDLEEVGEGELKVKTQYIV